MSDLMSAEMTRGKAGTGAETAPAPKARGRHVSMAVVNFWLDAVLLATLALYGWVTAVLRFVFPAPTAAAGWRLWGWGFDQWYDFQFNILCVFTLGVLLHVMLHWNWVCSVIASQILKVRRPHESLRTIYGVGLLIVLLHLIAFGVVAAMYAMRKPSP
jgi:hypothetical protein